MATSHAGILCVFQAKASSVLATDHTDKAGRDLRGSPREVTMSWTRPHNRVRKNLKDCHGKPYKRKSSLRVTCTSGSFREMCRSGFSRPIEPHPVGVPTSAGNEVR